MLGVYHHGYMYQGGYAGCTTVVYAPGRLCWVYNSGIYAREAMMGVYNSGVHAREATLGVQRCICQGGYAGCTTVGIPGCVPPGMVGYTRVCTSGYVRVYQAGCVPPGMGGCTRQGVPPGMVGGVPWWVYTSPPMVPTVLPWVYHHTTRYCRQSARHRPARPVC